MDLAFLDVRHMIDRSIWQTLRVANGDISQITAQNTLVPDLPAAFCVEWCRAQNDSGTLSITERVDEFSFTPDCNNSRFRCRCIL